MSRLRSSIASLLGFVVLVAIGCIALTHASLAWDRTLRVATLLALSVAILGALYSVGEYRAFCGGFAIFGWGYLLLSGPLVRSAAKNSLVRQDSVRYLYSIVKREVARADLVSV